MDDQWGAALGEDVFKKTVEEYISVHFRHRFTIIPGRRPNKAMIRPLIASVKEMVTKAVFQAAQRFDTLHDIRQGDPFTEILEQPITE
jgi:hypothetical protein